MASRAVGTSRSVRKGSEIEILGVGRPGVAAGSGPCAARIGSRGGPPTHITVESRFAVALAPSPLNTPAEIVAAAPSATSSCTPTSYLGARESTTGSSPPGRRRFLSNDYSLFNGGVDPVRL